MLKEAKVFKEKMNKAIEEWEKERQILQKKIAELGKNSAAEADALKGEGAKMRKEASELKDNLAKSKDEVRRLNSVTDGLKNQIDELRKELEQNALAAKKKLEAELSKLKLNYDKAIQDCNNDKAEILFNSEMKGKEELESALAELRQELVDEMETARCRHEVVVNSLSEQLVDEKESHVAAAKTLTETIEHLKSNHSDITSALQKAHDEQIKELKQALKKEHDLRVKELKENHDSSLKMAEEKSRAQQEKIHLEAKEKLNEELRAAAENELRKLRQAEVKKVRIVGA